LLALSPSNVKKADGNDIFFLNVCFQSRGKKGNKNLATSKPVPKIDPEKRETKACHATLLEGAIITWRKRYSECTAPRNRT